MTDPIPGDTLRSLEPAIQRAEDALRSALASGQVDPSLVLALRGVAVLRGLLEKLIQQVANQDLAERVAVYQLVTERCATALGRPVDLVYPAVLSVCGESDATLTEHLPAPDPEVVAALADVLIHVKVTYALKGGDRAARTVLVFLHDARERQVREQMVEEELPWEQTPEDVREKFLRDGQQPVVFNLYPEASNGS